MGGEKLNYVAVHQKIVDWGWFQTPFMFRIFCYIILRARRVDGMVSGIDIKRGQALLSLNRINKDTGISIQSIRTCLMRLERTREITQKSTNKYRVITVCNYDNYQANSDKHQQTTNKQATSNQQHKKEVKSKRVKEKTIDQNEINFDRFWSEYPRKVGKKKVQQMWKTRKLGNGLFPEIMEGLRKIKASGQWEDMQYIPHPSTWLNQERWKDDIKTGKVINCRQCQYYNGGKCRNLSKKDFDASKCGAYLPIAGRQ